MSHAATSHPQAQQWPRRRWCCGLHCPRRGLPDVHSDQAVQGGVVLGSRSWIGGPKSGWLLRQSRQDLLSNTCLNLSQSHVGNKSATTPLAHTPPLSTARFSSTATGRWGAMPSFEARTSTLGLATSGQTTPSTAHQNLPLHLSETLCKGTAARMRSQVQQRSGGLAGGEHLQGTSLSTTWILVRPSQGLVPCVSL